MLSEKLNLLEIGRYNINGDEGRPGIVYWFGDYQSRLEKRQYLLYTRSKDDLEIFGSYEQFIDCSKQSTINDHWKYGEYNRCN